MKTATVNFKTDDTTKRKAQRVSEQIGIPLSSLLNAYLHELAATGSVYFAVPEPMSEKTEKIVEQAQKEIEAGETVGPFKTTDEAITYLKKL